MTEGLAIRALGGTAQVGDDHGDGRSIEGLAVPWGAVATGTREYGQLAETFDRRAFDHLTGDELRLPILDEHQGRVIGVAHRLWAADDGLRFAGRMLDSDAAREFAQVVSAGVDGVSIEYAPDQVRRGRGAITHTRIRRLAAIAGAYAPALIGASAAIRRMDTVDIETPDPTPDPQPDPPPDPGVTVAQVEAIVNRSSADIRRLIAEGHQADAAPGLSFRSLADAWHAIDENRADTDHRDWYARALIDQVTGNNPGVVTAGVESEVHGIVTRARVAIEAWGRRPLDGSGMSVDWPYFDGNLGVLVAEQLTQKAEIASVRVDIEKGTSPIKTYAGGSDISYQLLRRSAPSYLDAYSRIMLAAYAAVTDGAFVDLIEGTGGLGAVPLTWATATAEQIQEAVFAASVAIKDATGEPAAFGICGASVFIQIGGVLTPPPVLNALGTAQASTLSPNVSGLPIYYSPNVAAGKMLVSNRLAAAWHEDGPFQASEEDVAKLGTNVAFYGMGAASVYIPAGVVVVGT